MACGCHCCESSRCKLWPRRAENSEKDRREQGGAASPLLLYTKPNIAQPMESEPWWVGALINFGATFFGVLFSFWIERRRSMNREKEEFGKILTSVLVESSNNHAILNNVRNSYKVGQTSGFSLNTEVLGLALASPVFHKWASHSLIVAATIVRTNLGFVNNILALYRHTQATGGSASERGVEELKIRAKTALDVISVMQGLLDAAIAKTGAGVRKDDQSDETDNRLARIFREETEAIKNLSA